MTAPEPADVAAGAEALGNSPLLRGLDLTGWHKTIAHVVLEAVAPLIVERERKKVFDLLGHDHYVIFTEDGWTTEHSVECRLSGHMHECATHSAIGEWASAHQPEPGRWRVVSADGPVPVLERADAGGRS